jgi:hypothetical protein
MEQHDSVLGAPKEAEGDEVSSQGALRRLHMHPWLALLCNAGSCGGCSRHLAHGMHAGLSSPGKAVGVLGHLECSSHYK